MSKTKKFIFTKAALLTILIPFYMLVFTAPALADSSQTDPPAQGITIGKFRGLGAYEPPGISVMTVSDAFAKILSNVIGFLTLIGGLFFLIYFMIGGLNWIMAGGKPENIQKAQDTMTNAVIGLIIMVAAYSIAFIISQVLGIDFLNIGEVISKLGPGN